MQAQVQTSDRLVIQTGNSLGDREGCAIVELTDQKYADLRAALAQPNGGIQMPEVGALKVLDPPPEPEPAPTTSDLLDAVAAKLEAATTPKQQAEAVRDLARALRGAP